MANAAPASALERLLRPLSRELTTDLAQALVKVQADQETQSRYDELADKRASGTLSPDEEAELESLVRANTFVGILKAQAQMFLSREKS